MKSFARKPPVVIAAEIHDESGKPQRLLEIFRKLQAGEISEEEAVDALEIRRERRYGRVGRFVEAITS